MISNNAFTLIFPQCLAVPLAGIAAQSYKIVRISMFFSLVFFYGFCARLKSTWETKKAGEPV